MLPEEDPAKPAPPQRYTCPFPGCTRSFRDFWRLKVHYRAPPSARGSGVERGHGQELPYCPLCNLDLRDVKYHKCAAAPGAGAGGGRRSSGGISRVMALPPHHYMLPRPGMPHGPITLPTGNFPYHPGMADPQIAGQQRLVPAAGMPHMGHMMHQQQPQQQLMPGMSPPFNPAGLIPPQQLQPMAAHTADGMTPRAAAAVGHPLQHHQQQPQGDPNQQQQWWANQPPSPPPMPQQPWPLQEQHQQQLPVPAVPAAVPLQQHQQQPSYQQQLLPPSTQQPHMQHYQQQQQPAVYPQQQQQYMVQQYQQPQQQQQLQQQHLMQPRLSSSGSGLPNFPSGLPAVRAVPTAPGANRDHQHLLVTPRAADASWHHQQMQQSCMGVLAPSAAAPAGSYHPHAGSPMAAAAAALQQDSNALVSAPMGSGGGSSWAAQLDVQPLKVAPGMPVQQQQQQQQQQFGGCYGAVNGSSNCLPAVPTVSGSGLGSGFDLMQSSSSAMTSLHLPLSGAPGAGAAAAAGAIAAGAAAAATAGAATADDSSLLTAVTSGEQAEDAAVYEQVVGRFRASLAVLRAEILSNSSRQGASVQQQQQLASAPAALSGGSKSPNLVNQAASSSNSSPARSAAFESEGAQQKQLQAQPQDLNHQASGADSSAAAPWDATADCVAGAGAAAAPAAAAAAPATLAGVKRPASEPSGDANNDSEQGRDTQVLKRQAPGSSAVTPAAGTAAGAAGSGGLQASGPAAGSASWTDTPPPPEAPEALLELATHAKDLAAGAAAGVTASAGGKAVPTFASGGSGSSSPAAYEVPKSEAGQGEDGQAQCQVVQAARVSALIAAAMETAGQLGMQDARGLMPKLLVALNEHISALSEIHEAEATPQGGAPAVADTPLINSAAAVVDEAPAATAAATEAAAATGQQQQQQQQQPPQQQQPMACLLQPSSEALPVPVSAPLQQLPWEQPADIAAAHAHSFFDHIDRTYLEQQQQQQLVVVEPCPAAVLPSAAVAAADT